MAALIREGLQDPTVIQMAGQIVRYLPQKDYAGEVEAIHAFVRDRVRYTRDPYGVELLRKPVETLAARVGDCDCKTILVCALLGAIGHRTRLVAIGPSQQKFAHVFAEVRDERVTNERDPKAWVPLDCTEPWPVGWAAVWKGRMVVNV
jgi:transglutaminase-like putative cysteine protease